MFKQRKLCLARFAVLAGLFFAQTIAYAVLPPGAAEELKEQAGEVLRVKILEAQTPEGKEGQFPVIYGAEVLEVQRSKSQIEKGDKITIRSYSLTEETLQKGFVGPKVPELLPAGWVGIAYLNQDPEKKEYGIAAYGHSFEKVGEK